MEGWGAGPGQIGATGQVLLHRGALLAVEWDHQRRRQTGDTGLWWGIQEGGGEEQEGVVTVYSRFNK